MSTSKLNFHTTPADEALILGFVICLIFSGAFAFFAVIQSYNALKGRYSKVAAIIYGLYIACALLLLCFSLVLEALELFAFGGPVVAFVMYLFERKRNRKINPIRTFDRNTKSREHVS